MVLSVGTQQFIDNKNQFFSVFRDESAQTFERAEQFSLEAHDHPESHYAFSSKHYNLLAQELWDLFNALKERNDYPPEIWFYCYFLSHLLEEYHTGYGQHARAKEFKNIKASIKKKVNHAPEAPEASRHFLQYIYDNILISIQEWLRTPRKLSKARDKLMFSNLLRLYWIFTRLSLEQILLMCKDKNWMSILDKLLHHTTDVDKIISRLEIPTGILNVCSVGLFVARIFYNVVMIGKHVCFPSPQEQSVVWYQRLTQEIDKRHIEFINDGMWGVVNFLTNFKFITFIPPPVKLGLMTVFLFADIALILYARSLAYREYQQKRIQYEQEKLELCSFLSNIDLSVEDRQHYQLRMNVLSNQIDQLNINWETRDNTLLFLAAGACILAFGFTASLLVSPPLLVVACYLLCLCGAGVYLSKNAFADFSDKRARLNYAQHRGTVSDLAIKEYSAARNHLAFSLVKNTFMPALIIGTFVFCWPAAIALTLLYMGYEIYHAFSKHRHQELLKRPEPEIQDEQPENALSC